MVKGFFTPGEDEAFTNDDLERRRRLAESLMQQGSDYSPVQSWTQGAARLAQAVSGSLNREYANKLGQQQNKAYQSELLKALGGGQSMPSAPMGGGSAPAPSAAPTGGAPTKFAGSQSEFVNSMMPHAMKVAQETGLDPRLVIAQSALETGFGRSAPGNNFFGIKSHGQPGGNTMATTEVVNGQPVRVNDSFRAYSDMGESAKGYAEFLRSNPRYKGVLGAQGLDAQIEAMARSGYATDPAYGQKLRQIASGLQPPATPDGMPTSPVPSNAPPMAFAGGQPQQPQPQAPQQAPQGQQIMQAMSGPQIPPPQPTGNVQAGMMAVLTDPRFSPQQKQQAMQLFQMQEARNNKNPMIIPEGGTLYDPRTGRMTTPTQKKSDQERQYEAAQRGGFQGSFFDYQQQLRRAGGTQVNVNSGENKFRDTIGTESAKLFMESAKEGTTARADVGRVRQLRTMVESLPGGFVGGAQAAASRYGIKLGPNAGNVEAAEAIINQLVPAQRPPGSGTMSDRDVDLFKSSLPRLSNTPQGNKIILDTMEAMAQYKAAQAEIATAVVTEQIDRNEGMRRLQALPDPFEAFKGFASTQPAEAPPAARPVAPGTFSDDEIQAEMKRRGLR